MRVLERVDFRTDLHFQTQTTIDTLDYSGHGFNAGSKLVIAAAGSVRRTLPTEIPSGINLPDGFRDPCVCLPGILAITAPKFIETHTSIVSGEARASGHSGSPAASAVPLTCGETDRQAEPSLDRFLRSFEASAPINAFPLILLVDDSEFTARTLNNWLWVTFTRSNPAADVTGVGAFVQQKHWGCRGSLVIDARIKPHHAPPLIEDPEITRRVDALFAKNGPLHGVW